MKPIKEYQRILIFNPSFLGDTVLTTPLIRAVKKLYPKAEISFCVRDMQAQLYQGHELLTHVITFDKRKTAKGLSGFLNFAQYLNTFNFDLIINVHKSLRSSALLLKLQGADIVGFKQAVLSSLFKHTVNRDMNLQEPLRNLMLLTPLIDEYDMKSLKRLGGGLTCYIDNETYNRTKYYYSSVTGTKKVIAFAPGSVWATKRYPAKYYAEIANTLYEQGYAISLFGSKEDREQLNEFLSLYKYSLYDYAEKTSLAELPAFIANSNLLVCNDSGTMHIAIAAGVPCVAVFGATVEKLGFFPYDDNSIVIENDSLDCRPCGKHGGKECPKSHFKCMLDISPSVVTDTVINKLKGV